MPKQRQATRPNSPRSPGLPETRPRSVSLNPPRYGIDFVDFAGRPDARWVSGAQPGRFPFGDRLARETGGAIDPHAIPSVVVPGLPDRGASVGGKVAMRPDAPIEVARHELAHSLGADEALAHRAERNPRTLAGLSKSAPPVDGWAIGFEFQTAGVKNPKTYSRNLIPHAMIQGEGFPAYKARTALLPKNYTAWTKQTNIGEHKRVDYQIKSDDGDMEVETVAFPETVAGRQRLQTTMVNLTAHMTTIANAGFNQDGGVANVATLDAKRLHGIAHSNNDFEGKPQATAGFKLEKVSTLIDVLAKRAAKYGWGDYWAVKNPQHPNQKPGLAVIGELNKRVGQQLGEASPNVRSLLHLIASYTVYGGAIRQPTKYLKNIGNTLMVRNNLGEVFSEYLSDPERLELETMLGQEAGQAKIAALFGAEDFESLRATKILPQGVKGGDNIVRALDLTVGKVFDDLLAGTDAIHAKAPDQSIGKIDEDNTFPGQDDAFDIGASEDAEHRKGILVEIRGLNDREPYTNWTNLALMMFDLAAELNEGVVPPQQPAPPQQQQAPLQQPQARQPPAQPVAPDHAKLNELVGFIDAKGNKARAKVIKVHDADHVRVNHKHAIVELSWTGEGWAAPG